MINDPTAGGLINSKYLVNLCQDVLTIVSGKSKWHPLKRYYYDETIWNRPVAHNYNSEIQIIYSTLLDMKLDGVL